MVHARFVGCDARDEAVGVGVAVVAQPEVVALAAVEGLGEESVVTAALGDLERGLRQNRRLDEGAVPRPPREAALEMRRREQDARAPVDNVRDEAIGGLSGPQRPELAPRRGRVEVTQRDGVEAGVPEPLPRIAAGRRGADVVVLDACGGIDSALDVAGEHVRGAAAERLGLGSGDARGQSASVEILDPGATASRRRWGGGWCSGRRRRRRGYPSSPRSSGRSGPFGCGP